jgi:hypothetical protein
MVSSKESIKKTEIKTLRKTLLGLGLPSGKLKNSEIILKRKTGTIKIQYKSNR